MDNFISLNYVWKEKRVIEGRLAQNANVCEALEQARAHLVWVGTFNEFALLGSAELLGKNGKFVIEMGQTLQEVLENFKAQMLAEQVVISPAINKAANAAISVFDKTATSTTANHGTVENCANAKNAERER